MTEEATDPIYTTADSGATGSPWSWGLLIFFLGFLAAAATITWGLHENRLSAMSRFQLAVAKSTHAVARRLADYEGVAAGVHNLFLANANPTAEAFRRAVNALDVRQQYPEIRNVSFVQARQDDPGAADASAAWRYTVAYVWPLADQKKLIGLNLATQPAPALASVRDAQASRSITASAPFDPGHGAGANPIFIVRFPVFEPAPPSPAAAGTFLGTANLIIDTQRMLQEVAVGANLKLITLRIQDAGATSGPVGNPVALAAFDGAGMDGRGARAPIVQEAVRQLPVFGRWWQFTFAPAQPMLSAAERALPWWEAGVVALTALILALVAPPLAGRRQRAMRAAQAEHAAHKLSEMRFATIFNQQATGVAITDTTTKQWLRVNDKYAEMLGYAPGELMRTNYRAVTHPADLAEDEANLADLRAGRIASYTMQKRMLRRNGETLWVNLTVSPLWEPGGAPTSHIAVLQDITREIRARDRAHRSRKLFERILDHLPVAVVMVDASGKFLYRNERFEALLGYSVEAMNHVDVWWKLSYPAHESGWARRRWEALCASARTGSGIIDASERTIRNARGENCTVRISGALLDDGYLVMMEDLREFKAAQSRVEYLAYYDPLTRLPNSHSLLEQILVYFAQSERHHAWGALLRLDIDRFKVLNETRGRNYGNELLTQIAGRLLFYTQHYPVARFGDDEFIVVLPELASDYDAAGLRAAREARGLLELLNAPYSLIGSTYYASLSVGIARFKGSSVQAEELLKRTEIAVTQARGVGYGTYAFFDPRAQRELDERARLETELRMALDTQQLELHCQAQVTAGRITGAEALVRWPHPARGLLSPSTFIPLAEETGLILPLGDWVMRTACGLLATWRTDPVLARLTLSVNVSPQQFYQPTFVQWVITLLAEAGVPPRNLKIEVTEGVLMRDFESTVEKMGVLRRAGVGFSLDDFGTGYSSLAYLKGLPISELKIDQRFVHSAASSAADAAIVRTIITLGQSLGVEVLAEGVETEAQRQWLQGLGCDRWQGFLLSKALPAPEFETLARLAEGSFQTARSSTESKPA